MSTEPRLNPLDASLPSDFGNLMGHAPALLGAFGALYAEFWQNGSPGPALKEMTRLRNARVTDCGF